MQCLAVSLLCNQSTEYGSVMQYSSAKAEKCPALNSRFLVGVSVMDKKNPRIHFHIQTWR